ncbi:hypothetical protein [Amycolatopsis sp. WQ 127309]|nr:hypothetical protein [Amycolatopsis sp. WQ 127309]UOZ03496.1 hypothetical protein MUY22_32160 [Amycolatopsis sp. WQ 127309]
MLRSAARWAGASCGEQRGQLRREVVEGHRSRTVASMVKTSPGTSSGS